MQTEIDSQETPRPIRILGINGIAWASGNDSMTDGRVLPWLQSTADQDVWTSWQVQWRDVVILGPGNELLETYNLTEHNLSDPANYVALKNLLIEAAQ